MSGDKDDNPSAFMWRVAFVLGGIFAVAGVADLAVFGFSINTVNSFVITAVMCVCGWFLREVSKI